VQTPRHALTRRPDELQILSGRFEEKNSCLCQEWNQSSSDVNRVAQSSRHCGTSLHTVTNIT